MTDVDVLKSRADEAARVADAFAQVLARRQRELMDVRMWLAPGTAAVTFASGRCYEAAVQYCAAVRHASQARADLVKALSDQAAEFLAGGWHA